MISFSNDFFAQCLLAWYEKEQRILPWRISSKDLAKNIKPNPYHVWLSEVMLQQTLVETVKPYYQKFIQKWPDIFAFHQASLEEILQDWSGLGYYSRAKNLKLCAKTIVEIYQGTFPNDIIKLKQLKGIGDYTAGAIAAISFNSPVVVVDGNIERILTRLFAIDIPLPKAKKIIKEKMKDLTPQVRVGEFVQALMDLGALICRPKTPLCLQCPIQKFCTAFQTNTQQNFPIKALKKKRPIRYGAAFVILSNDQEIYLQKREEKGLLAHMTQLPNYFGNEADPLFNPPFLSDWQNHGDIQHIFTHFTLILTIYRTDNILKRKMLDKDQFDGYWTKTCHIEKEALPTLFKKALKKAGYCSLSKSMLKKEPSA